MARAEASRGGIALRLGVALFVVTPVVIAVLLSGRPPDGPVEVAWDHTPCARCGMLVSDPRFAAQRHDIDGSVHHYDDPGCLLADLAERDAAAWHAVWLHHMTEERWVRLEEAAFLPVPRSPMGYDLGVVSAGEVDGALDLAAARAQVASRERDPR